MLSYSILLNHNFCAAIITLEFVACILYPFCVKCGKKNNERLKWDQHVYLVAVIVFITRNQALMVWTSLTLTYFSLLWILLLWKLKCWTILLYYFSSWSAFFCNICALNFNHSLISLTLTFLWLWYFDFAPFFFLVAFYGSFFHFFVALR